MKVLIDNRKMKKTFKFYLKVRNNDFEDQVHLKTGNGISFFRYAFDQIQVFYF